MFTLKTLKTYSQPMSLFVPISTLVHAMYVNQVPHRGLCYHAFTTVFTNSSGSLTFILFIFAGHLFDQFTKILCQEILLLVTNFNFCSSICILVFLQSHGLPNVCILEKSLCSYLFKVWLLLFIYYKTSLAFAYLTE